MIRYVFKEGRPLGINNAKKADAQKIGEALAEIKRVTKGRCNSKTISEASRSHKYLRQFYEWDDAVCGDKYRQEQARILMSCLDVVEGPKGKEQHLPAFISLVERTGRGYRTYAEVIDSAELQAIALRQAEGDFEAYEKRLMQFADICGAIRAARELIKERREKYERGGREDRPRA
jgi:predicted secreted protein